MAEETRKEKLTRLGLRRSEVSDDESKEYADLAKETGGLSFARVAEVRITAEELRGLLDGSLIVDPDGPQVLPDSEFYFLSNGDAVYKLPRSDDETGLGWIGITLMASNFPEVVVGGVMGLHPVRFIPKPEA